VLGLYNEGMSKRTAESLKSSIKNAFDVECSVEVDHTGKGFYVTLPGASWDASWVLVQQIGHRYKGDVESTTQVYIPE